MTEYLIIKSQHGNLEVRITTNENSVRIIGKTDEHDVDRSFQLDDPDLQTKVGTLWAEFKTEINNQLTEYLTGIETAWSEFQSEQ